MALKLLTLLVIFATCRIGLAQQECSTFCKEYQFEEPAARSVVRGQKHRASRSKGHPAVASRQQDPSNEDARSSFCSIMCGTLNHQPGAGDISSRQGIADFFRIPQQVLTNVLGGSGSQGIGFPNPFSFFSGGQGSSSTSSESPGAGSGTSSIFGFLDPFGIFSGGTGSSGSGSGTSSSGSSSGVSGPSGSSSGSSGLGSNIPLNIGTTQGVNTNAWGGSGSQGSPLNNIPNPFGGSSSSSGTGVSGSGSGFPQITEFLQNPAAHCALVCNYALSISGFSRQLSSRHQGASHAQPERHGRQPVLGHSPAAHNTRQASVCPDFCRGLLSGQGSSTGISGVPTAEFGASAIGSGGSHTGSQSSSGSVNGSASG